MSFFANGPLRRAMLFVLVGRSVAGAYNATETVEEADIGADMFHILAYSMLLVGTGRSSYKC